LPVFVFLIFGVHFAYAQILYKQDPQPFEYYTRAAGTAVNFDFGTIVNPSAVGAFTFVLHATSTHQVLADVYVNGTATGTTHVINTLSTGTGIWNQMQYDFTSDHINVSPGQTLQIQIYSSGAVPDDIIGSYTRPTTTNPITLLGTSFYPSLLLSSNNLSQTYFDTGAYSPVGVSPLCTLTDISQCIINVRKIILCF